MKHQIRTNTMDNVAENTGDVLVTPREVCARLGLTPYELGCRTIPRGVRPQLVEIGPHKEYRLVFSLAELKKIFSPTPETVDSGQGKTAPAQTSIRLNFE